MARPRAPPRADSTSPSVSSKRTMRRRPALSAARRASSRLRVVARTRSRFATFAHAISRTNVTAAIRIQSDERTFPTTRSGNDRTLNDASGPRAPGKRWRNVSAAGCRLALADSAVNKKKTARPTSACVGRPF